MQGRQKIPQELGGSLRSPKADVEEGSAGQASTTRCKVLSSIVDCPFFFVEVCLRPPKGSITNHKSTFCVMGKIITVSPFASSQL